MSEQPNCDARVHRTAWFLLAVGAALVTPSVDPVGMALLWVAGVVVFEAGFLAYRRWRKKRRGS